MTEGSPSLWQWASTLFSFLPGAVGTTFQTAFVAILFAFVLGALPAWLTHHFRFAGRKLFSFAFLAPIAVPPAAVLGIYQRTTGFELFNSPLGVGFCVGIATAPFVFLFFRVSLARLSPVFRESAQMLGYGPLRRLLFLHIPLLAVCIFASVGLVVSEVFSDFATASAAGTQTFSVAFHNIWMGTQNNAVATLCVAFITGLLIVPFGFGTFWLRKFSPLNPPNSNASSQPPALSPPQQMALFTTLALLLLPGFLFPFSQTVMLAIQRIGARPIPHLLSDTTNSIISALFVSALALAFTLLVSRFFSERRRMPQLRALGAVSLFLYAIPALTLVFIVFHFTGDQSLLTTIFPSLPNTRVPMLATTALRLLPFLLIPVVDSLARVPETLPQSARTLGCNASKTFWRAIFPSVRPAFVVGTAIVFIESVKEMTITQGLQPFNYSSLAFRLFQFKNTQQIPESAVYVLIMQIILLFPILRLVEFLEKDKH